MRRLATRAALVLLAACSETTAPSTTTPVALGVGSEHTCALMSDGTVRCWGIGSNGRLGDGGDSNAAVPVQVRTTQRFVTITAGVSHTCALTADGRAYCWGDNSGGAIGSGDAAAAREPVPVAGGLRFKQLSAGEVVTCGVTGAAALYCWGWGETGILGLSADTDLYDYIVRTPLAIAPAVTFTSVSMRADHACAVRTDRAVLCWGNNYWDQTGTGSDSVVFTPSAVVGEAMLTHLAPGVEHTCALAPDHTALCWGADGVGQLGNDTLNEIVPPMPPRSVFGGLRFNDLVSGDQYTCGIVTNGAPVCWGGNTLGNALTQESPRPLAVGEGLRLSTIAAGLGRACGITTDARVFCWDWTGPYEVHLQ